MIKVSGSTKRSFLFSGNSHEAIEHYSDIGRIFNYLQNVKLTKQYSKSQFRMMFRSTELSIYTIQLFCDLEVLIDKDNATISVRPFNGEKPLKPKSGMHSSIGMANFSSTSQFVPNGKLTRVYYHLNLDGELPKPLAFSLVPDKITNHIAENIAKRHIAEIADGFIIASLADFERKKFR
jgi:hypothetical protein